MCYLVVAITEPDVKMNAILHCIGPLLTHQVESTSKCLNWLCIFS